MITQQPNMYICYYHDYYVVSCSSIHISVNTVKQITVVGLANYSFLLGEWGNLMLKRMKTLLVLQLQQLHEKFALGISRISYKCRSYVHIRYHNIKSYRIFIILSHSLYQRTCSHRMQVQQLIDTM